MHRIQPAFVILLALLGGLGTSCSRDQGPSVLLISVDTLRPDHLGFMGHDVPTSPHLDALAARSRVWDTAYSQSGWTLPSLASLHTGLYPRQHGATDVHYGVAGGAVTLAEVAREHGLRTAAVVSQILLAPAYGLNRGFDHYDATVIGDSDPKDAVTGAAVTDRALAVLDDLGAEPFFLWAHYLDPHFDYVEHAPWAHFGDTELDRYDQEIAYTDQQIGRLLEGIEARGLGDNLIVIFTSDHGEEFGEHGGKWHGTLHEEVLRVPFLISGPGVETGRDTRIAEQVDLFPTLAALLGWTSPKELPGENLLDPMAKHTPVLAARDRPPGFQQGALIDRGTKVIHIEETDISALPEMSRRLFYDISTVVPGTYLYDLKADPGERTNLFQRTDPGHIDVLRRLADHYRQTVTAREDVALSDEARERLRSLGYMN